MKGCPTPSSSSPGGKDVRPAAAVGYKLGQTERALRQLGAGSARGRQASGLHSLLWLNNIPLCG